MEMNVDDLVMILCDRRSKGCCELGNKNKGKSGGIVGFCCICI